MISLVIITDGAHLDNLRRTITSTDGIVTEKVIVYQGNDLEVFAELRKLSDFSVITTPKGNADLDRNFAYGLATEPWILALDDDEWLPEETRKFISIVTLNPLADLVWFKFRNLVDGKDIKEILGEDPHPRLWRRKEGLINWPTQAHTYPQINSPMQVFAEEVVVHDRKFDELYARHEKRMKMMDGANMDLEKRFIQALKNLLGRK